MEYWEVWFAIFAVIGVAVVAPTWVYFVDTYLTSRPVMQLLSTMLLPVMAMIVVASWLQPG